METHSGDGEKGSSRPHINKKHNWMGSFLSIISWADTDSVGSQSPVLPESTESTWQCTADNMYTYATMQVHSVGYLIDRMLALSGGSNKFGDLIK